MEHISQFTYDTFDCIPAQTKLHANRDKNATATFDVSKTELNCFIGIIFILFTYLFIFTL